MRQELTSFDASVRPLQTFHRERAFLQAGPRPLDELVQSEMISPHTFLAEFALLEAPAPTVAVSMGASVPSVRHAFKRRESFPSTYPTHPDMKRLSLRAVVLWWVFANAAQVWAHNPGLSSLRVDAVDQQIELTLQFAPPYLNGDGRASLEELTAGAEQLKALAPDWVQISTPTGPLPVHFGPVEIAERDEMLVTHATLTAARAGTWTLELKQLGKLVSGHREYVSVTDHGQVLIEALLSAQGNSLRIPWPQATAMSTTANSTPAPSLVAEPSRKFTDFVKLGIEHILTGYDHLLYLAGLIVVCRKFRGILSIITSFTLAHSITLALATTGAVKISSGIVEPMIAASIAYVGLENLFLRGREPRGRWLLAFVFGLVHGFGFAGLLQEIGVGANGSSVLVPLFSFNLGVEIGQLAVVSIALPVLFWARRRPRFESLGQPASSALIALAGMYWFVERVWF